MVDPDGPSSCDAVILGCGMMGAALARTLAARGSAVAVWNRTHARAQALAGPEVTPVEDIVAAVGSSQLIIGCTDTHENLLAALEPIQDWHGATLANLVSSTPRQASAAASWIEGRQGRYLDGSILCYPSEVGTAAGSFAFSGAEDLWEKHRHTLSQLGPPTFSSSSVEMASATMAGLSSFYIPALSAYVGAVTYLLSQKATAEDIRRGTELALSLLQRHADEAVTAISTGHHETDQATIEIFAKGVRSRLPDFQAAGYRMRVLEAALETLENAEAAGLGHLDFYAQTRVL